MGPNTDAVRSVARISLLLFAACRPQALTRPLVRPVHDAGSPPIAPSTIEPVVPTDGGPSSAPAEDALAAVDARAGALASTPDPDAAWFPMRNPGIPRVS